jgi:hypothetical protein
MKRLLWLALAALGLVIAVLAAPQNAVPLLMNVVMKPMRTITQP